VRRNRFFIKKIAFCAGFWLLLVLTGSDVRAVESSGASDLPVTQAWMSEALDRIDKRLADIEELQERMLEMQDKLSEEHKQIRYWVHRN